MGKRTFVIFKHINQTHNNFQKDKNICYSDKTTIFTVCKKYLKHLFPSLLSVFAKIGNAII